MTRIVWDDYIDDQLHWAERYRALAEQRSGTEELRLRHAAEKAAAAAKAAMRRVLGEPREG